MHLPSSNPQILLLKIVWWAAGQFYQETSCSCPPDQFRRLFLIIFFPNVIVSNSCELTKKTLNSTLFQVYYKKKLINKVWKMWLSILNQPQYLTKNTSAKMWRFHYDMVWLKSILSPTFIMRPLFKHKWILQHVGHKRSCHYTCMTLPRIFCRVVTIGKVRNTFYNHPFNLKVMCCSKKAWKKRQQITKNSRCKQIHQWASQPRLIKMWCPT